MVEKVTGDDTWMYPHESNRKAENNVWVPRAFSNHKLSLSKENSVQSFSIKGIVLQKPCKAEETINSNYHRNSVLAEANSFYRRAKLNTGMHRIKSLHGSAPVNNSKLVQEYLTQENIEILPHPACCSDVTSCNFLCPTPEKMP